MSTARFSTLSACVGLAVGCALGVVANAQTPITVVDPPWTMDQVRTAIRELINEQDYPLHLDGEYDHGVASRQMLTHFIGRTDGRGRVDFFWVDRERHLVVTAQLWSRMDDTFHAVTVDGPAPQAVDPARTERLALQLVTRHCSHLVEDPHRFARDLDGSPHAFVWQALDASGVRLPDGVTVAVDALTGEFCGWQRDSRDVTVSLPPEMTSEEVTLRAREVAGWSDAVALDIYATVIGEGPNQRILWYAFEQEADYPTCVCVADSTGEVTILR